MENYENNRDRPNNPETHNCPNKYKPTYSEDNKNTKADHTTEPTKTDNTAPMLQLVTGKDNLQDTQNDTHPLGTIPQKSRQK